MTVRELIDALELYDEETEVRVAFQPDWPLRGKIQSVIAQSEIPAIPDEEADETLDTDETESDDDYVWIAIDQVSSYSSENPYAPRGAWA